MRKSFPRCERAVRLVAFVALAIPVWWASSPTEAQTSQPQIVYVYPAGGQQGTKVEVSVRGRHLVGATGMRVFGQGITGKVVSVEREEPDPKKKKRLDEADNPDLAKIEVTLAADAEPGERDFRVVSPGGVSNRFRFYVGQVPELNEAEPNSLKEEVQELPGLPVVVNGQTFQADRDIFRFSAKAGQTLVLEASAQKIRISPTAFPVGSRRCWCFMTPRAGSLPAWMTSATIPIRCWSMRSRTTALSGSSRRPWWERRPSATGRWCGKRPRRKS